jgi:hypothetical protein
MSTTVTWTQDGSSNYEVSSAEHLKQIMNKGALYTDAGTPPTDYWAAGTNYIQTADIDLLGDSTDIKIIGTNLDRCESDYDGGEFSISNWSYVDIYFDGPFSPQRYVGLFGETRNNVLKNIRLKGIFTLRGFTYDAGMLVGLASPTDIYNVECDFSEGSVIIQGDRSNSVVVCGPVVGVCNGDVVGVSLKGSMEITLNDTIATNSTIGGVIGQTGGDVSFVRNLATFPSGLNAITNVGGITALRYGVNSFHNCINAMVGDMTTTSASGKCGGMAAESQYTSRDVHTLVNAMTGNITSVFSGGIFANQQVQTLLSGAVAMENLFNYMTGNISGGDTVTGGIIGRVWASNGNPGRLTITSSINAMNGSVYNSILPSDLSTTVQVSIDTSFGLTFTVDEKSTASPPTGLLTLGSFPDLPYKGITGTDTMGNSYDFDFIFANLSGNGSFSTTHLIVQGGVGFFIDGNVIPPPIVASPSVTSIPLAFSAVSGATSYQITYEGPIGGEIVAVSGLTALEHNVTGVEPGTAYTIRLYADTGSGYQLEQESTTNTLPNVSTNYDKLDYQEGGFFNLRTLIASAFSSLSQVWNGVFGTGDVVSVEVPKKSNFKGSFINLGDTLSIKDISGVVLPFDPASGTGQGVNVILSDDTTTVPIVYDETQDTVTVNSVVYYPGQSFILNGKKVTVSSV